jgi:SAM-dependent methyltransferase
MPLGEWVPTRCAICETEGNAATVYEANFRAKDLDAARFSARRPPDGIHYRIVRCDECGLLRSDPIAEAVELDALYAESEFTYGAETANLKRTYGHYLHGLRRYRERREALVEIGCGNGFFLEEALDQGFTEVAGVEPSVHAAEAAVERVRGSIRVGTFREGLFSEGSFDVVCLFQVMDHLADPVGVLSEVRALLRPGGLLLVIQHNASAVSARLLGERSPIVDIEHTYLYTPDTLSRLCGKTGFAVLDAGASWNRYSLSYLAHLMPFGDSVRRGVGGLLSALRLGELPLWVPLGNFFLIARRADDGAEG